VGVLDVGDLKVIVRRVFEDGSCQHVRDINAGKVHHPRTDVVGVESDLGHSDVALQAKIDGGARDHAELVRLDDVTHVIGFRRDRKPTRGRHVHHGRALHAHDTVAVRVHRVRGRDGHWRGRRDGGTGETTRETDPH
jgi:hypothetical protein